MTTRKQHLRPAGFEVLRLIRNTMPSGITAGALADRRGVTLNVMRKTLKRCESMQLALPIAGHTEAGKAADFWKLTTRGQRALDDFLMVENTPKATEPEPDEDESDVKWPRANPDEVVRQAIRTQPSSVFDMARMMWRGPA